MRIRIPSRGGWLALWLTVLAVPAAAEQQWAQIDAGLPRYEPAFPSDVNNRLQVVGFAGIGPPFTGGRPFLWDPTAGYRVVDVPGVTSLAINNHGTVAGVRRIDPITYQAFLWADGKLVDLSATFRRSYPTVSELTDTGIVLIRESYDVGYAADGGYRDSAIFQNTLYDLTTLMNYGSISGVSDLGTLAGSRDARSQVWLLDGRVSGTPLAECHASDRSGRASWWKFL